MTEPAMPEPTTFFQDSPYCIVLFMYSFMFNNPINSVHK